jgi:hypothetical protein
MSESDDDTSEDREHVVITIRGGEPRPVITVRLTREPPSQKEPASVISDERRLE